jgi:transcriptional antiterminator NusG
LEENQELEGTSPVGEDLETEEITNEKLELETPTPTKPKNPNAKWYILQAYTGYEMRVEKTILEKLRIQDLEHLVEEIFIPSEDIIQTKGGKKRKINQKYFPGYVLIQMELTPDLWHLLKSIDRVSGFIGGTAKDPLPLDERELDEIRSQISEGFQQAASEEEYHVGQKVMITEGPFSNFNGVIDEISRERKKLKVLVSIFGRPTPVEVEFEKVKNS